MKQEINLLAVYQKSQPREYAKSIFWVWGLAFFFLGAWNTSLFFLNKKAEHQINDLQAKTLQQAALIKKTSAALIQEYGVNSQVYLEGLNRQIEQKEMLLSLLNDRQHSQDLTFYLNKVVNDYVKGTFIDSIKIEKGQSFKVTGRSESAKLVPQVLDTWQSVPITSQEPVSQLKILKLDSQKNHVKFEIQVQ